MPVGDATVTGRCCSDVLVKQSEAKGAHLPQPNSSGPEARAAGFVFALLLIDIKSRGVKGTSNVARRRNEMLSQIRLRAP